MTVIASALNVFIGDMLTVPIIQGREGDTTRRHSHDTECVQQDETHLLTPWPFVIFVNPAFGFVLLYFLEFFSDAINTQIRKFEIIMKETELKLV